MKEKKLQHAELTRNKLHAPTRKNAYVGANAHTKIKKEQRLTIAESMIHVGNIAREDIYLTLLLSRYQAPKLVNIDRRAVKLVQSLVEVTHTNFAEITRMAAIT